MDLYLLNSTLFTSDTNTYLCRS